jgi:hypothetical protein
MTVDLSRYMYASASFALSGPGANFAYYSVEEYYHDSDVLVLTPGRYVLTADAYGDEGSAEVSFSFRVRCGIADLAEPLGILDLADIVAFVEAFLAGCL